MPIVDPNTGEVSNAAFAIDDHAATQDEPSILDSAANVVTKGVPLTALSVVNSFANTGIEVSNWITGGDTDKLIVQNELGDGSLTDYYNQHSEGIETAGLIAGSLLPGLGAIRGATAAVKAVYLARTGLGSEALAEATGLLAPLKQKVINAAKTEIDQGSAGLFGGLTAEKTQAIALGVADQSLQGLIYSAATAATMHASPLLDQQTLGDTVDDIFWGGVVGGVTGGIIEGVGTRSFFNKMLANADDASKAQEISTRLGLGDYTAGDHAASIIDSLDNIPEPTTQLQGKKLSLTTDSAMLAAKKSLQAIVPKGDEDVSNGVFDVLMQMKQGGNLSKDDLYERLGRLAKISRYTGDDEGTIPTGDTFFINRFAKGTTPNFTDVVSDTPHPSATTSLRYALAPGVNNVSIARFGDSFIAPSGSSTQLYPTAKDAWAMDHDLWIDKNLQVHINPNAPNLTQRLPRAGESRLLSIKEEKAYRETGKLPEDSKPLYGAPVILDLKDGGVSTSAIPVVGDFGKPQLIQDSLKYGDQLSQQGMEKVLTADTPTIDANARYVWMRERGIKAGDTIATNDIPALETLYHQATSGAGGFEAAIERLSAKGTQFSDGTSLSTNPADLLEQIRSAKDSLISDIASKNPKMGSDEIAIRANVPESYITSGLHAEAPEDFMLKTEDHYTPNHAKLEYNVGATHTQDGMVLRGAIDTQYRIGLVRQANQDQLANYISALHGNSLPFDQLLIDSKSSDAGLLGTNSQGFISYASADYGTLAQETERVGRVLTKLSTQRMSAVSEQLSPSVNALRGDATASAEWGLFRAVRQRTGASYQFLPDALAKQYNLPQDTAVLSKSLTRDNAGNIIDWKKDYIPDNFVDGGAAGTGQQGNYTYYSLSPKVADFERTQSSINKGRLIQRDNWLLAQGKEAKYTQHYDNLYTPPIDTAKQPFFALVKNRAGTGMADDGVAIITGATQDELQSKIAVLSNDFSIYTKANTAEYHRIEGDYEYNRNFAQSSVNSTLERRGILNNVLPDTRAETIVKDYVDWNSKQELSLLRDHVELGNAQLFAELRAMGERFQNTGTSETGFVSNFTRRTTFNPYDGYIKQALGVSPKESNYPLWSWANEKAEAFFDTAFRTAQNAFQAAYKGVLPYEEAAKMASKFGLGNPYESAVGSLRASSAYYNIANKLPDARFLQQFMSKANAIMGATVIRLDAWQQLVHITSSPILMLGEAQSALQGKGYPALRELLTTPLPDGSARVVPAISKVMFNAVNNYFKPEIRNTWMPVFKQLGIIRDSKVLDQHYEAINNLALPYGRTGLLSEAESKLKSASDFAAKWVTQSDRTNDLLHFVSADMGRQIFEAAGYKGKQLTDNIATFQNRVFGNFVASQRPVAFQGPLGQSVGLFQTYYFNLLQQVLRHVENGEGKTLAIMAGLQTSLFGLQSAPGFQAINNHIIGNAAGNNNHSDLYSAVPNLLDKKLGDFLMYGALSGFTGAGLYTRGDINPRAITILPVNPLQFPAVRGAIAFYNSLASTSEKIASGGNIPASLLIGLEHNGLSRPLTGLAQLVQGFSTTSKGELIASTGHINGLSDLFSVANFSRLVGARPLDDAIAMDALYRSELYKAKDNSRITALGSSVRTTMYNGVFPDTEQVEQFAKEYAASGGRMENFSAELMKWSMSSNASVANKVFRTLKESGTAKNMMQIMGGQPLPDFLSSGSTATSSVNQDASPTQP